MAQEKYIIKGNPVSFLRHKDGRQWDECKQTNVFWEISIDAQRQNQEALKGPIHIHADFFFPMPFDKSKKIDTRYDGLPHAEYPSIISLLKFVEHIGKRVLCFNEGVIAKITTQKIYGKEARTELTVSQIKE